MDRRSLGLQSLVEKIFWWRIVQVLVGYVRTRDGGGRWVMLPAGGSLSAFPKPLNLEEVELGHVSGIISFRGFQLSAC